MEINIAIIDDTLSDVLRLENLIYNYFIVSEYKLNEIASYNSVEEILKLKNLILREYTEINISDNPLKTERFRHIDENESYKKIYEYLSVMILLYNNLTH